jgi:hypothetical protein
VPTASAGLTLAGLLVSSGLFGWSAVAGGLIRHDELRTDSSSATIPAENAAPVGGSAPARQGVKSDGDRDD